MIPSGHSRTVFSGQLPGGEIWACGLWANEAPSDEAATVQQAQTFGQEFITAWTKPGSPRDFNTSAMTVDRCTVYSYLNASGKASFVAERDMALAGNSTQPTLPDQCSLVSSLLTGYAGRRNRGRCYWPLTSVQLTAGQMPDSYANSVAGWLSALVTALNSHLGDQHMVVLSQVAGSSRSISAIRVDTRVDIQRRRANRQAIAGSHTVPVT